MPQPYSDDLRSKLLESYEAGVGSLRELAAQFRVSWGYSKKIRAHQVRTGNKTRPEQFRHGPESCMREAVRDNLRNWLREQPDLTEAELRERLAAAGVQVSKSRVGQVFARWVWGAKKIAPCRRARQRGQPQAARGIPPGHRRDRAGEADFPG